MQWLQFTGPEYIRPLHVTLGREPCDVFMKTQPEEVWISDPHTDMVLDLLSKTLELCGGGVVVVFKYFHFVIKSLADDYGKYRRQDTQESDPIWKINPMVIRFIT